MISAESIRAPVSLEKYRADWRKLFVEGCYEPSASFEWTHALCQSHISDNDHFFLILIKDGSKICGIMPMVASRNAVGGMSLVTIAPISERYNTHVDLLLEDCDTRYVQAFVDALFLLPFRWDFFRMTHLLEDAPIAKALETVFLHRGEHFRSRYEAPSFFLSLPASYEEYMAARTDKFRNHLRRAEKKLARLGSVAMVRCGEDIDLDASLAALFKIEEKSWKHIHGTAISAIQRQTRFYEAMCRNMSDAGWLHLTFLTVNGNPVAYNLGLACNSTYSYLKTSYDEKYRQQSPSTILRARLIQSLIADKLKSFDFPGEPYQWETQWTNDLRWHRSILLYNRTQRARLLGLLARLNSFIRRRRDEKKLVFHDPFSLKPPRDE